MQTVGRLSRWWKERFGLTPAERAWVHAFLVLATVLLIVKYHRLTHERADPVPEPIPVPQPAGGGVTESVRP